MTRSRTSAISKSLAKSLRLKTGRREIFQRILLPYDGAICLRLLRVARELLAKNTHRSDIATLKSCKNGALTK